MVAKKAIIVTHPTQRFKAVLLGLDYEKLCMLAQFRYAMKRTIKRRFKTVQYYSLHDLNKQTFGINAYIITEKQYQQEIKSYFNIK